MPDVLILPLVFHTITGASFDENTMLFSSRKIRYVHSQVPLMVPRIFFIRGVFVFTITGASYEENPIAPRHHRRSHEFFYSCNECFSGKNPQTLNPKPETRNPKPFFYSFNECFSGKIMSTHMHARTNAHSFSQREREREGERMMDG